MASKDSIISMQDENFYKTVDLIDQKIDIWKEYVLFSGLWWFGVALSIIPWIIWFLIRKKKYRPNDVCGLLYYSYFNPP